MTERLAYRVSEVAAPRTMEGLSRAHGHHFATREEVIDTLIAGRLRRVVAYCKDEGCDVDVVTLSWHPVECGRWIARCEDHR